MLLPYRKHYNDDRLLLDMMDGERGRDIGTLEVFLQLSKYEIYAIRYDREGGVDQCILRLVDSKSRILRESGGAVVKALDHQYRQDLLRLALRLAPLFVVPRSRWWEDEVGTADDEVPRWLLSAIRKACGAHNNVVIVDGKYRMTQDDVIDLSKRMVRWRAAADPDVPPVLPIDFAALQLEQELAERELAEAATALEEVLGTEDYDAATRLSQRVDCAIARVRIGAARIDEAMRAAQVLMGGDLVEDAGKIGWPWLPTPEQARWREAGDIIWDIERSQRKVDDIRKELGDDGHVDEAMRQALQAALDELRGHEEAYDALLPEGIDDGIRKWYLAEHPDETDGCPIPADATFADLDRKFNRGENYWDVLGGWGWSDDRQALRNRCLDQLAKMWGVKYDDMLVRHLEHI